MFSLKQNFLIRSIMLMAIMLLLASQETIFAETDFVWQTVADTFVCNPGEGNIYTNADDHSYGGAGSRCICSPTWTYEYNNYLPMGFFATLLKYNTTTELYPNPTLTGNIITEITLELGTVAGMVGGGGTYPRYANPGYFNVYWLKNDVEWIQGSGQPHDNEITTDGGITYNTLMAALETHPDALVKLDTCYWLGEQAWNTEQWYSYALDVSDDPEFTRSVMAGETFTLYLAPADGSDVAFNFHAHVQDDTSRTDGPILTITTESYLPGDASMDGMVDVGDLGILAANYGKPGLWETGDFNGDGMIDVGDLGILAANYGMGTSGADFAADYANVFTANSIANSDETSLTNSFETSSQCSLLGLIAISGLLMSFMTFNVSKVDNAQTQRISLKLRQ